MIGTLSYLVGKQVSRSVGVGLVLSSLWKPSTLAFAVSRPPLRPDLCHAMSTISADPYIWLEDVESEDSLNFAKQSNERCLSQLGNPEESETGTYDRVLKVLESDDRIPSASVYGHDDDGEAILFNFWKDSKVRKRFMGVLVSDPVQ
jgi:prolyl oligopeptidase